MNIDLTTTTGEELLKRLLDHPLLAFVHFARPAAQPPELGRADSRDVGGGPPPLRSTRFPERLPDLESRMPRASRKVNAANAIYKLVAQVAALLTSKGIP